MLSALKNSVPQNIAVLVTISLSLIYSMVYLQVCTSDVSDLLLEIFSACKCRCAEVLVKF
jgi:hypothetical protein